MVPKQLVVLALVLAVLAGGPGIVAADSHHEACPDDNPGQGLLRSTAASDGTSLANADDGITHAADSVGCDSSSLAGDR